MSSGIQKLLLLGAGRAHLQVLARLAQNRPADLDVTLLSPYPFHTHSNRVPGLLAGQHDARACQIPLEPLLKAAGVRWMQARCTGLDLATQTVRLAATGGAKGLPDTLPFHRLSIDTGGIIDRQRLEAEMPGASSRALIVRPIEAFAAFWPQVPELALKQPVSVVVIGAGAAGIELVLAAQHGLHQAGAKGARYTLLTGGEEPAAHLPPGVRQRLLRLLKARGITVLRERCTGIDKNHVVLASGATLVCDVPILATGTQAPPWLRDSGLALSDQGHVQVNAQLQSSSHAQVFATGDVASHPGTAVPHNGAMAASAGPVLAHNLLAAHHGQALRPWRPTAHTLDLISCGNRRAIASWGPLQAEGGWVWRWKERRDLAFMARYSLPSPEAPR